VLSSPHCWSLDQSAWVVTVVSTSKRAADSTLHQRPPSERAARHCNHHAIRSPSANRLERSVIANVTAVESCQQERLAVQHSHRRSDGTGSYQGSVRQRSTWVHPSAPAVRTLTNAAAREHIDVHAKEFQVCFCVHDTTVLHAYQGKAFADSDRESSRLP
jgi:hypothetical protein